MSISRRRRISGALVAAALVAAGGAALATPPAADAAAPTYRVNVGAKGTWNRPDDTPAAPYIDKDGTFYYEQAHALYGADDGRAWSFYSGPDFDNTTKHAISSAVNPANSNDKNNDTTWRCNNSPTGKEATNAPSGSGYAHRNYCDPAGGMWVDPDTGDWYSLIHNEFTPQPFGDGVHYDAIDRAVSTDQGRTWTIKDHVITSPYSTKRGDTAAFPQKTYHYGDGDQRLFVDTASGYFYAFYGSRIVDKNGGWKAFHAHVARAPISGKMAPSSWQKWYDGAWTQPGTGGKESNMVPVDSAGNGTGYTPAGKEYNPANTGTTAEQVAAGTTPATSPLFVMDITWNAYLGLYIGEPQAVDQSGKAPQQIYATDNLATQKWKLIGDTGSHTNASWYRWFLDSANKTSTTIVGRSFRSYCSFGCSGDASAEYLNLSIDTSAPAAPVDTTKTYRIAGAGSRVLAQVSGSSATTSQTAGAANPDVWSFAANGDGSYRIANTTTGALLGVDSTTTGQRAWGTKPTVTAAGTGGPSVGQQWWVVRNTSGGTYRLVNRYSGLALGISADSSRPAETTPARFWTGSGGVGGSRTAAEQTLGLTAAGTAPGNLDGVHTLAAGGKALDVPDHSTTAGTQLITYTPNSGANQQWRFTRQSDGSYEMANVESGLCADVSDGSTTAGAKVVQWTCNQGANQHWKATRRSDGTYTLASVKSGLALTTASTANGALVTQQTDTGTARQRWTLG
ncbi:RICIN domain-containing protein [Streptomyces sp. NPDC048182]|uniref:RICIN domain-containing protein n=1 Tax=Streptomyces sp. NPDC048182 TaxID=3365507 RepID=UPI00371118F2